MSSVSFPALPNHQKRTSSPVLLISQRRHSLDDKINRVGIPCVSCNFHSPNLKQLLNIPASYPSRRRQKGQSLVPLDAKLKSSDSGDEGSGALETVLKLYSAIKDQNVRELSDIIDDECQCICNFFSCFQPLQGKKQVVEFFTSLIKYLGDHIEFVVQPTLHDGMVVGIKWRLEWSKTHMPLGKGFSFHTCQAYHGKVMIRNVEMFMEPFLHVEPVRLKIIRYLTTIMDKISSSLSSRTWKKIVICKILALLFITTILVLTKLY